MSYLVRDMLKDKRVVLASASPRRKELLRLLTDDFEVIPSAADESTDGITEQFMTAQILSERKCREVAKRCHPDENTIVIGCDTIVISPQQETLGKPKDDADAFAMLKSLQGERHWVVSGVTIYYRGKYVSFSEETEVIFRPAADDELKSYISSGEPSDKAGAYAIQGLGGLFVDGILGDYNNVVGLPVGALAELLGEMLGER
ncbi:MAG: Maf family protein [Oscillospiraceae bacterium]